MIYRARRFGDDINTDYIVASRRKRDTLDPRALRQYLFEEIAPPFAASVQPGDVIVAGKNFGCGSAMEVAVTAVLGAGIPAVLAKSFSRTYYRNAVNNGLRPIVCDTLGIGDGDALSLEEGSVLNRTTGESIPCEPLPEIMRRIIDAGGLVEYFRRYGGFAR